MSESSAPPPGSRPSGVMSLEPTVVELAAPVGLKRLTGRKGNRRITFTPREIVIEHADVLRGALRFAPGAVLVAAVDAGPATPPKDGRQGRFPILHRLSDTAVVPLREGIDGWLWTSGEGSAFTVLGPEAPNVAFLFSPPLSAVTIEPAFEPEMLGVLAKRSPLGQPAVFGLLLHVQDAAAAQAVLERLRIAGAITDREVPPTQRRHLPDDKPANPAVGAVRLSSRDGSVPPPGTAG